MVSEESMQTAQEPETVVYGEEMGMRIVLGVCGLLMLFMVGGGIYLRRCT